MPSGFFEYQDSYSPIAGEEQEVIDFFNAHNITLYESQASFYCVFVYPESVYSIEDVPTVDHDVEIHAQQDLWGTNTVNVRHAFPGWFFGLWTDYHYLHLTPLDYARTGGASAGFTDFVLEWDMIEALEQDVNTSTFIMECEHVSASFAFINTGNYTTLEECWINDEFSVYVSYDIDFDAMKPTAFTLITQLIGFREPDFGIPGILGTILNYSFGIVFWITVAVAIYAIVTRLIPTATGGIEN